MFGENSEFTVQERIMLHLSNYNGFREHYLNPESVTQVGIAGAVGIARNHVPRSLSGLKHEDLVTELKGRVKGSSRRKKVYFLSERGLQSVNGLKERLRTRESSTTEIPETKGFVGRESEVREIRKAMSAGKAVLITGAKGIGKTYLASKIAQEASRSMPILWYNVAEGGALHPFLRSISEFLNRNGNGLLGYRLAAASALDDGEIMNLLAETMKGCIVAIDDYHNASEDMKRFTGRLIENMGKFDDVRLLLVSESPSLESKKIHTLNLTGLDRETVRRILAARQVGNQEEVCEIAEANPLFLKIISSGSGPHSDIAGFLEDEFGRMSDEERRAMWAISLHPHPVNLELLAAMGDVDYQILVNLAGKGLVQELGDMTFDSHRMLKDFFLFRMPPVEKKRMHLRAAIKLAENNDAASWLEAQQHLLKAGAHNECAKAVVLNGVKIINKGLRSEIEAILAELDRGELEELQQAELLLLRGYVAKLRGEWENALGDYQKALAIFERKNNQEKMADVLAKTGRVHLEQGKFDTAREYFDKGLGCLGKEPHIVRARILDEQATIHLRKKELEEARAKVNEAMEQAKNVGDREMQARIHNTIGNMHMSEGSFSDAKPHYELSLEGLKDVDDQMAIVLCNNLAIIEFKTGDVEKAIELWELAAGKAEAMKNLNVMLTFSNLGSIYFSIGNWNRAVECCIKALEISEMVGKHNITAASRSTLGHIALYRGEDTWLANYETALELRVKLGDMSGQASSHNDIARGQIMKRNWKEAESHLQAALALGQEKNDPEQLTRSWLGLAEDSAARKEHGKAKEFLKMALVKSKEIKNMEFIGQTYRGIGMVSAQEGEDFVAERYLKESVEILEKERRPLLLAQSLYDYAWILRESGLGEPEKYLKRSGEIFISLGLAAKPAFV